MPEQKKSGCLKYALIAIAAAVGLVIIGITVLYMNREKIARNLAAKGVEMVVGKFMDNLEFPPDEKTAIMSPILEFTEEIRNGGVKLDQIETIMDEIMAERVLAPLAVRAFELQYLEKAVLLPDEKEEARLNLSRVAHGVMEGKIKPKELDKAFAVMSDKTGGAGGKNDSFKFRNQNIKYKLTLFELREVLTVVKKTADDAQIPRAQYDLDPAGEIRKALERGMGKTP